MLIVPANLPVARVAQRILEGGYDVPQDKTTTRAAGTHVIAAIEHAYDTDVYDSLGQSGQDFTQVARYQYQTVLGDTH